MALAPGYFLPLMTYDWSLSKLYSLTFYLKVSFFDMKRGTPTSFVLREGSGEMTERAAWLTLLPIIFMRKRPSFFSRI